MGRKGRFILFIAIVLVGGSVVALDRLTRDDSYRNMTGPVGVIDERDMPEHGFLGVEFEQVVAAPLIIDDVLPGTGAAESGLRAGDEVLAIAGVRDPNGVDLQRIIEDTAPGQTVKLIIRRDRKESDAEVRLISAVQLQALHLEHERRTGAAMLPSTAASPATDPAK